MLCEQGCLLGYLSRAANCVARAGLQTVLCEQGCLLVCASESACLGMAREVDRCVTHRPPWPTWLPHQLCGAQRLCARKNMLTCERACTGIVRCMITLDGTHPPARMQPIRVGQAPRAAQLMPPLCAQEHAHMCACECVNGLLARIRAGTGVLGLGATAEPHHMAYSDNLHPARIMGGFLVMVAALALVSAGLCAWGCGLGGGMLYVCVRVCVCARVRVRVCVLEVVREWLRVLGGEGACMVEGVVGGVVGMGPNIRGWLQGCVVAGVVEGVQRVVMGRWGEEFGCGGGCCGRGRGYRRCGHGVWSWVLWGRCECGWGRG